MTSELERAAREKGIRYFLIAFVDLFGVTRAKLVPASAVGEMLDSGAGFAGFAAWLDMTPAHPDMFAVPDPDSLIQLPWKPEFGWLAADLYMDDAPVHQAPRNTLKRVLDEAATRRFAVKTGVECEFFLLDREEHRTTDRRDTQIKPCYDQMALMRRADLITRICDGMESLGWGPYQNDHEDANGQFEMNWGYADALKTADRHTFFKFMVKSLAEECEVRASFMPKPFPDRTGNGCHAHVSLWSLDGRSNVFLDPDGDLGISTTGYHFLGGWMRHARAMSAMMNPVVNSYKRLAPGSTASGASWSPDRITYGGNNRTHMVRIPAPGRIEIRLADGACNPYLLQGALISAGLNGIDSRAEPGKRSDFDMYAEPHKAKNARQLPQNLLDALRALESDTEFCEALGTDTTTAYVKLKKMEWRDFCAHISSWEIARTLDC